MLHAKWSPDPAVGWFEMYYQGALVIPKTFTSTMYLDNGVATPLFLSVGQYRSLGNSGTSILTVDAVRVGSTLAEVTPGSTATTTPTTTAPTTTSFGAVADSRVEEARPTKNLGLSGYLNTDGSRGKRQESYLMFSPAGLSGIVKSAKLRLYVSYGSVDGPAVSSTSSSWTERSITWSNRPAVVGAPLGDVGNINPGTWIEYDVTAAVLGNGTYSFALTQTSTDGASLNSREVSTNKPQLVVQTAS